LECRNVATFDRAVTQKERDLVLGIASSRNLPVEVVTPGSEREPLRSRLLHVGDGNVEKLVLEMPTDAGRGVALRPDELVNVLLMINGQRYGFRSTVKKRDRKVLSDSVEVPTLVLDYPEQVIKLQRRRFFRVRIPSLNPMLVKCVVEKADTSNTKKSSVLRFETTAVDISSGGIALRVPKSMSKHIGVAVRMALLFQLQGFSRPIRIIGEVRHVRSLPEGGEQIAGVQFIEWQKTLPGRRAINWITRYVVGQQREELRKKSGME